MIKGEKGYNRSILYYFIFQIVVTAIIIGAIPELAASEQKTYPNKPIKLLIGFPPGGATDLIGRMLADSMEKIFQNPVVVMNKPGAAGIISVAEMIRSTPDGYTLNFMAPALIYAHNYDKKAPTINDVEVIANVNVDYGLCYVRNDSPYKNLKELFTDAKIRPKEITMATAGINGAHWVNAMKWEMMLGTKFKIVTYRGGAEVWPAVMGGHVDSASGELPESKEILRGGKIRSLAVASEKRYESFPEVPTFRDLGYDSVSGTPRFLIAPKGLPKEVLQKLEDVVDKAMSSKEMDNFFKTTTFSKHYMKREEAKKYFHAEDNAIQKVYEYIKDRDK